MNEKYAAKDLNAIFEFQLKTLRENWRLTVALVRCGAQSKDKTLRGDTVASASTLSSSIESFAYNPFYYEIFTL